MKLLSLYLVPLLATVLVQAAPPLPPKNMRPPIIPGHGGLHTINARNEDLPIIPHLSPGIDGSVNGNGENNKPRGC